MKRILIYGMSSNFGGIEEYLMNIFRNINRKEFIFDFIITDGKEVYCEDEIKKLGGKVYYPNNDNILKKNKSLKQILKMAHEECDYIYFNTSACYNIFPYLFAKRLKYKKVIVHAHNTKDTSQSELKHLIHYINRVIIRRCIADEMLACSQKAGKWLFGKKVIDKVKLINNAIDIEKFKYNENCREKIRSEMNLQSKFVIGHIARFTYQKNHEFLIDVFNEVIKTKKDANLLLIGEGELKDNIIRKVKAYGIEDKVIFYGTTNKVYELYNAMDVFVLPSHYEGLPVCGIEAQVNGLNCIFSSNITNELKYNDNTQFVDIDNVNAWSDRIKEIETGRDELKRRLIESYDIKKIVLKIEKILN